MKKDIFIDGETGTTGLQVHEKLIKHPNVNIISVDQSKRKDISYKKEMLAKSDVTFLCLPDEISIETAKIADELGDKSPIIIDASTAHRTNPNWSYGLPELGENYRKSLENSKRIASPGCYSTGANVILKPLITNGILSKNPANTIKSGFKAFICLHNNPLFNCTLSKIFTGILNGLTRSITPALGLFVKTFITSTWWLFLKYLIIFSALVPEPDANRTILLTILF